MKTLTAIAIGVFATSVSVAGIAQEIIPISAAEIDLLGLEFKALGVADRTAGINLPARVVASPEVFSSVVNRFGGVLESWLVEPGQQVEKGQLLASIRSVEVMELQQQFLLAETEVELERDRVRRDTELFESGIISQQRLQQTSGSLRMAELKLESLGMQLAVAGLGQDQLDSLSAQDQNFGLQQIRASSSGVLTHRAFSVGQYVETNAIVATLGESSNAWVSIQVPARLATFVDPHSVISLAETGDRLTLRQRDFEIETSSQTLEILAQFDRESNVLPGQLLNVSLSPGQGSLFVPATAVVFEGNSAFVFVQSAGGVEVKTPQLVAAGAGYLVQSGLREGEQLLVQGAALVKGMQLGLGSVE